MSKGKKIGGIVLIIIGTIFLVIGIALIVLFAASDSAMEEAVGELEQELEEFQENNASTYGEITDIDDEGMATIEYYCAEDGYEYVTYFPAVDGYRVGSVVLVCYDPDNPTNVMVPDMYMDSMRMADDTVPVIGIVTGSILTGIGLILLIVGIVLLVNNHMDKKWTDEINARNAAQGIGNVQYSSYQQPGGMQYNGYQQPNGAQYNSYQQPNGAQYNGYGQPGGASGGYQQPSNAYNSYGQPGGAQNPYQQPEKQEGNSSNPYQQNNNQNM